MNDGGQDDVAVQDSGRDARRDTGSQQDAPADVGSPDADAAKDVVDTGAPDTTKDVIPDTPADSAEGGDGSALDADGSG